MNRIQIIVILLLLTIQSAGAMEREKSSQGRSLFDKFCGALNAIGNESDNTLIDLFENDSIYWDNDLFFAKALEGKKENTYYGPLFALHKLIKEMQQLAVDRDPEIIGLRKSREATREILEGEKASYSRRAAYWAHEEQEAKKKDEALEKNQQDFESYKKKCMWFKFPLTVLAGGLVVGLYKWYTWRR